MTQRKKIFRTQTTCFYMLWQATKDRVSGCLSVQTVRKKSFKIASQSMKLHVELPEEAEYESRLQWKDGKTLRSIIVV